MSVDEFLLQQVPLEEIFSPGGILDSKLGEYEFRPSQLEMAQAVLETIQHGGNLCVEAGTGTGKTLAYLIPALYSRKRVIISTATRNLQEQLFQTDIPFIRRHLCPGLEASYMKGRRNYLCLRRFREKAAQGRLFRKGREEQMALAEWVSQTPTGDRAELDWIPDSQSLWAGLDARSEICTGSKCDDFRACFITRMRQRALESDIIVVNHALFFANLALQSDEIGQILPDFGTVILDEAHEIEDIASNHFGTQISSYQVEDLSRDFRRIFREFPNTVESSNRVLSVGLQMLDELPQGEGHYSLNFYRDPIEGSVDLRDLLRPRYREFRGGIEALYHRILSKGTLPEEGDAVVRRLEQLLWGLDALFEIDDPDFVYWFERRGRGTFLRLTPIRVSSILRDNLFKSVDASIMTSATLSVDGRFGFLRERLGVPEPTELVVRSEFNYLDQAILYIPSQFPEPRSDLYSSRLVVEIERLLEVTEGGAFLLFTSFHQMHRVHDELSQRLPFNFMFQGERPRSQLLKSFKETPIAVLCATSSFWQGVDVRGDSLRAVIIDKLPFHVPTEPVVAARLNHLKQEGQNPFATYSLPEAVITLKQGLGRLIRSRRDRGILAVLDSRLRTRSYGRTFLQSLPNCPLTDNIEDLKSFILRNPS